MKSIQFQAVNALDSVSTVGPSIPFEQLYSASFQAVFGDITAAGTFKLEASNDASTPVNWCDIPNQSDSIVAGASSILTISNSSYKWVRPSFTTTATGSQSITTVADGAPRALAGGYFLLTASVADGGARYAVWLKNMVTDEGVAPVIPGVTSVEAAFLAVDADAVADAVALAITGLTEFTNVASVGPLVTFDNVSAGPFTGAVDYDTGFTFALTAGGTSTVTINMQGLGI